MIKVFVTTNQDNVICHVNTFAQLPRVGESVPVKYKGREVLSKVASVTHWGEAKIEVELWSENIHREAQNDN